MDIFSLQFHRAFVKHTGLKIHESSVGEPASFVTPSLTPTGDHISKVETLCSARVSSQTVSKVYCYIPAQQSDVWAKITDDHVDEAGAVTVPVHLCDLLARPTTLLNLPLPALTQINSWTHT